MRLKKSQKQKCMTSVYSDFDLFWPLTFEDKGFDCKIILITAQILIYFSMFFQYLHHTATQCTSHRLKHTNVPFVVPLFWYGNFATLSHFSPSSHGFIYLKLTKHDNGWTFCRK